MKSFYKGGLLRGLTDSGGLLRRVPQNHENKYFHRSKAADHGSGGLKQVELTRSIYPVG